MIHIILKNINVPQEQFQNEVADNNGINLAIICIKDTIQVNGDEKKLKRFEALRDKFAKDGYTMTITTERF